MNRVRVVVWVALALPFALAACSGSGKQIVCEGKIVGNRCITPTADTSPVGFDDTGALPDTSRPQQDTWTRPQDVASDVGPDTSSGGSCAPGTAGVKPIGAACSQNCECHSGLCYDGPYMKGFGFCSAYCDGGKECPAPADSSVTIKCMHFSPNVRTDIHFDHTAICDRVCDTLADCQALSSQYDKCGEDDGSGTKWRGQTLTLRRTCQVTSTL